MTEKRHGIISQVHDGGRCCSLKFICTDGMYRSNGTFANGEHHYTPGGVWEYIWLTHGTLVDERTGEEFTVDLVAGDQPKLLIFPPGIRFSIMSKGVSAYLCLYSPERLGHLHVGNSVIEWQRHRLGGSHEVATFLNDRQLVPSQVQIVDAGPNPRSPRHPMVDVYVCTRVAPETQDAATPDRG